MNENTQEYQYWSKVADIFDEANTYIVGKLTQEETSNWLVHQFKGTEVVLELGCGTGFYSAMIAARVKHLTATDMSQEMLVKAMMKFAQWRNVEIHTANCYRTPFADNIFDAVFLGNVIHIVQNPLAVMKEGYRVLKGGGSIVLVDSTSYRMHILLKLAMGLRYLRKYGVPPKQNRIMSPDDITQLAERAGFVDVESKLIGMETRVICLKGEK